jgi:plasmid stabilization system protein ParE
MSFRVELTRRAERDIEAILAWIASHSRQGAEAWMRPLDEVWAQLAASADSCALAPESDYGGTEIRHVIFKTRRGKPYRLLFTIRDDVVLVRHVRGPGQDLVPPDDIVDP